MAKLYFVPGLGTDVRIFSKLMPLLNAPEEDMLCLEYLEPLSMQETIPDYAKRLVELLPEEKEPPILIGMSLGGTIATEMSKLMPHQQLVVISSYKHESETPWLFKAGRLLPIYRLVPAWLICLTVPFFARLLRICNKEDAVLLKAMLLDRSPAHFSWGRHAIVHWSNPVYPEKFVHINGSMDHIFLKALKQCTHVIKGGTHNMVVDRAQEVADIINEEVL